MSTKYSITTVFSSFMYGIVAIPVQIEVYLTPGINTFDILGLCDSSIMESRGRIRAALVASGYSFPHGHITISISPSYIKKAGTNFDLPIAIGILIASKQVRINCSKKLYAEGELSLDGQIKATPGGALRLSCAKKENYDFYYLPSDQKPSCKCASLSCSLNETLLDCIESMKRKYCPIKYSLDTVEEDDENYDVSIIKGQPKALRTLFISACGWHNVLLVGSPGCGKTMAGRLIKLLLPPLSNDEVCEIFALNNAISRTLESEDSISASRPFRYVIHFHTNRRSCQLKKRKKEVKKSCIPWLPDLLRGLPWSPGICTPVFPMAINKIVLYMEIMILGFSFFHPLPRYCLSVHNSSKP